MPKHEVDLPEIPGYKFKRIGIPGSTEEFTLSYVRGVPTVTQPDKYSSYIDQRVIYEKKKPLLVGTDASRFYTMDKLLEYKPKRVLLVKHFNHGNGHSLADLVSGDHYEYKQSTESNQVNIDYWSGFYVIEN